MKSILKINFVIQRDSGVFKTNTSYCYYYYLSASPTYFND